MTIHDRLRIVGDSLAAALTGREGLLEQRRRRRERRALLAYFTRHAQADKQPENIPADIPGEAWVVDLRRSSWGPVAERSLSGALVMPTSEHEHLPIHAARAHLEAALVVGDLAIGYLGGLVTDAQAGLISYGQALAELSAFEACLTGGRRRQLAAARTVRRFREAGL